ncbi:transposase [Kribbella sp. NBC_00709]
MICADEFGPLNLQPRPGRGWFPATRRARLRATYNRTGGVRHMFAALDRATGQMFYRFRDRKRWREFLGFLKQLRDRFPTGKLYVVCDNCGPHKKAEVIDWCDLNDIELVFTPSSAS